MCQEGSPLPLKGVVTGLTSNERKIIIIQIDIPLEDFGCVCPQTSSL